MVSSKFFLFFPQHQRGLNIKERNPEDMADDDEVGRDVRRDVWLAQGITQLAFLHVREMLCDKL